MTIIPAARPKMTRDEAQKLLAAYGVSAPAILAQRGYFRDSMGVKGKNDRNKYDDAIAVITPRLYQTFNANTDPSRAGGRLAVLQPGAWQFARGMHHASSANGYPCLVQAGPVTVLRDNGVRETQKANPATLGPGGYPPYIHIHRGGFNVTSSEGCQTLHPNQWREFFELVCGEMEFYELDEITYVLTVREDE